MAKNGFKVMDSDMHIIEPADLWERYIDVECKGLATVSFCGGGILERFPNLRVAFLEGKRKYLWDNCVRLYDFSD